MLSRHSAKSQTKMEHDPPHHRRHHRLPSNHHSYPSFSSSVLDAIYRSIDQSDLPCPPPRTESPLTFSFEDSAKGVLNCKTGSSGNGETFRHNMCAVEKWSAEGITRERYLVLRQESTSRSFAPRNLSCSSSDSSWFSSLESEFAGPRSSSSRHSTKRPKSIRASISADHARTSEFRTFLQARSCKTPCVSIKIPPRDGTSGVKVRPTGKSYGDMKKVMRQPISPGGKLASFLNSIFTMKKARIAVQSLPESSDHLACSSTSSFPRSCLNMKSPPSTASSRSRRKSTEKRSVKFCPVNAILDEDCNRPCSHKSPLEGAKSRSDLGGRVSTMATAASEPDYNVMIEENRRVVEATREMLRNYQKRKESYDDDLDDGDSDGDDDAASCSSSDLFELDNFERYQEELPVYGTTRVGDNLAIANGLMV